MTIGIIPNINKTHILTVVKDLIQKLDENKIGYLLSNTLLPFQTELLSGGKKKSLYEHADIYERSDLIISIGGDGTMLSTAFESRNFGKPLLGLNLGKLGYLAEFDISNVDQLIEDLKNSNYFIEDRMTLEAVCTPNPDEKFFAVNDIVVDRGRWPKMIELTIHIDDKYVTTFSADGIIIATPTGSTGYSLSTGGPIVHPNTHAIVLSPISPHTLTMRPLVLSSDQKIRVSVKSQYETVQVSSDGQKEKHLPPPLQVEISKSDTYLKLLHTKTTDYFEILRTKLYWGLDLRNNNK